MPGDETASYARDLRAILILALAPAIGVGVARFAYSLLLPDMRASLDWSYAAAGFMNTINAVGYLGGALVAAAAMQRLGRFGSIFYGTLVCVAAMALSAATGNFVVLSIVRFAAGVGASIAFVGGGVAAARLSQRHPSRSSFLLGLYYIGPGLGIAASGIGTPLLLDALGPGSWWIAWGALAAITAILSLVLLAARDAAAGGMTAVTQTRARLMPMMSILVGYVFFSTGSIAYMTFMIAWLRDGGAGGVAQSAFWSLLGLGGICSPFLWSWLLAALRGGAGIAVMMAITFVATVAALLLQMRGVQLASAFVFGSAFFAVVSATTAFVRRNYPQSAWPSGVGAMTFAFALGQTIGPVLSGVITDESGSLSVGLESSAALLAVGAAIALLQREFPTEASKH